MKIITQHYTFLFFLLCSPLIVQSAQEKPIRKKTDLKVAIPNSYIDIKHRILFLQNFQSTSPELQIVDLSIHKQPREYHLPIPINRRKFSYDFEEEFSDSKKKYTVLKIYSLTHSLIDLPQEAASGGLNRFFYPKELG